MTELLQRGVRYGVVGVGLVMAGFMFLVVLTLAMTWGRVPAHWQPRTMPTARTVSCAELDTHPDTYWVRQLLDPKIGRTLRLAADCPGHDEAPLAGPGWDQRYG